MAQVLYDPTKGQFYTETHASIGQASDPNFFMKSANGLNLGTIRNYLPTPQSQASQAGYQRQPFTPNAFTQQQLAGMGGGAAPQWMMDAYTNKIGKMGGNANPSIPFAVTQSGFPGMGGKTAPASTTGTGG